MASQIIGISNKKINAEARKISSAAMVAACWSINLLMLARPCSWLMPAAAKLLIALVVA